MPKWMKTNIILQGDALTKLKELPNESINCVMTSPPYWALRDYGTDVEIIWDDDENCEHEWTIGKAAGDPRIKKRSESRAGWERPSRTEFADRGTKMVCPICKEEFEGKPNQKFCSTKCLNTLSNEERTQMQQTSNFCNKCGAWKGQLGLEPTFDLYIKHLADIFDQVKRVLRDDGTCWINLGDSYNNSGWANRETRLDKKLYSKVQGTHSGRGGQNNYPDKCLCMIPQRFAIGMINRGWILRNTIIWKKPNCMPDSVKDRFTVDFEYLFFFTKNKKYWFEQQIEDTKAKVIEPRMFKEYRQVYPEGKYKGKQGVRRSKIRNMRAVWQICPQPFPEAHFAIFPEELCETPIKAGCPRDGIVLDPFFGSGTTGLVALKQNKKFIGIELNPEYIKIAEKRLKPFLEQTTLK